ncbi:MAG: hypothetical protein KGJ98_00035 [Chloroflexota bacterium]|nr:hypothetical protein [Chloroflexota bacterium]
MRPNTVRQRIREGRLALNCPSHIADPTVVELIALAGFDSVLIDLEHDAIDMDLAQRMIVAADLSGITAIARVPEGDWASAQKLLDAGAGGIQVAHTPTRAKAEEAVAAVRYPPLGRRGASPGSRAARFGTIPWIEHMRTSNEEVLLNVMVEDREGLADLEEIASVEGVDLIVVGIGDLAGSLGITGNEALIRTAVSDLAARLRRVGKAKLGLAIGFSGLPLTIRDVKELGTVFSTINPTPERRLLLTMTAAVKALREEEAALSR